MKKYLIISIILLLFPTSIKACATKDMAILSKMYSNIETSYVFDENTKTFTVKISNLNPNLYYYSTLSQDYIYPAGTEEVINNVIPGESLRFKFYGNYGSCSNEGITSKYLTLPSYNDYYRDPLCKGYEDYKLCQKWATVNLSYEDFIKSMNNYIDKDIAKQNQKKEVMGIYDYIIKFIKDYYYFIIPVVLIIVGIVVFIKRKKSKLF